MRPVRAKWGAVVDLGQVMRRRADAMKQENDVMVASAAITEFRDEARKKVSELFTKKGFDASRLDSQYDEWFDEKYNKRIGQFDNGSQQQMFHGKVYQERSSDLDHLARYEATERLRLKDNIEKNLVAGADKDIRRNALSNQSVLNITDETLAKVRAFHPGEPTEALEQMYQEQLLAAAIQEQAAVDPDRALQTLEGWRDKLGKSYHTLQGRLAQKSRAGRVDEGIAFLQDKYGTNYESALVELGVQSNWEKYGIKDNNEAEEVQQYFRSLINDRNQAENKLKNAKVEQIRNTEMQILIEMYDPEVEKTIDIHNEAQKGNISTSFYKFINSPRSQESIVDDWQTVDEIYTSAISGDYDEAKRQIAEARRNGLIKPNTAVTLAKKITDTRFSRAAKLISKALQPGMLDRYYMDKNLKQSEAFEEFYTITATTERPPEEVAKEIVASYTKHILRAADNIRTPRFLVVKGMNVREAKLDLERLAEAKKSTTLALDAGILNAREYRLQMNAIEDLEKIARRYEQPQESIDELEEMRKNTVVD